MIDWDAILKRVNRDITTGRCRKFEGVKLPDAPYPTVKAMLLDLYRIRMRNFEIAGRYLCVSRRSVRNHALLFGIQPYPKGNRPNEVTIEKKIKALDTRNMTSADVAEEIGCAKTYARKIMCKNNMKHRVLWELLRKPPYIAEIVRLCEEKNYSGLQISMIVGCSPSFAYKILREQGVKRKPTGKVWNAG